MSIIRHPIQKATELTRIMSPQCLRLTPFVKHVEENFGRHVSHLTIGSLSKDVFERRTSTGSEAFSLFIYLDSNKFVLLSFFSLIMRIYSRVSTKPPPNDAKRLLPVEVRRSKTLLLKLPIFTPAWN